MTAILGFLATWIEPLIISIILGFSAWAVIVSIFDPKGLPKVKNLIINWTTGGFTALADVLAAITPGLATAAGTMLKAVDANGGAVMKVFRDPAAALAETVFKEQFDALNTVGKSTPANATAAASLAMGTAFGRGLASAAVTAAFEAALPEKLNTFNGAGPMLAEMAGFKDVAAFVLDPLYKNAFGTSLEYAYRAQFKPELPSEMNAVRWHSQRLLTDDQLRGLFEFSGLKSEYEEAFITSAYRAMQPRALATLYEDVPFPRAKVKSMLEFAGIRPVDVPTLLDAYEDASTKNVRHQYLSSLLIAAERGTMDEATLDSHLDTLRFSDTAKGYVHLTVSIRKLEQLVELYRKQVTELYLTGQISDAQYVPALSAIGIADADAEAHYALDSAKLKGRELAIQQRAAARSAEQLLRQQILAIRQNYLNQQVGI